MLTSEIDADRLNGFVNRIENVEEEKRGLNEDLTEIYGESKDAGFEKKPLKEVVKLRRMDTADRIAHENTVDLYKRALGMLCRIESPGGDGASGAGARVHARARGLFEDDIHSRQSAGADRDAVDPSVDPETGEILDDPEPEPAAPDPASGGAQPAQGGETPEPDPQVKAPANTETPAPEAPEPGNGAGGTASTGMDAVLKAPKTAYHRVGGGAHSQQQRET